MLKRYNKNVNRLNSAQRNKIWLSRALKRSRELTKHKNWKAAWESCESLGALGAQGQPRVDVASSFEGKIRSLSRGYLWRCLLRSLSEGSSHYFWELLSSWGSQLRPGNVPCWSGHWPRLVVLIFRSIAIYLPDDLGLSPSAPPNLPCSLAGGGRTGSSWSGPCPASPMGILSSSWPSSCGAASCLSTLTRDMFGSHSPLCHPGEVFNHEDHVPI